MTLNKNKILDKIEIVDEFKIIQLQYTIEITETVDEEIKIVSSSKERETYQPNLSIDNLPVEIQDYANIAWTDEVIAAYNEHINSII
ncbi:MAG: hypothetical protein GY787_03495 [Alteromonadales bacterium]|nr:hypothetical protein [Alteromonadales bacterium]